VCCVEHLVKMHKTIQRFWQNVFSTIAISKKPCYIDKLPNEVLETIVNLVVRFGHRGRIAYRNENGETRFLMKVMVLLQVSRQFRRVTQRAKFWHDFLFEFEKLVWNHNPRFVEPDHSERCGNLCNVLFSDPHFASWIARKSDWTFSIPGVFFVVAPRIQFSSVTRLNLYCVLDSESFLFQLRNFTCVTQLYLSQRRHHSLDLTLIPEILPQLAGLSIKLPGSVNGSLRKLANLKSLGLRSRSEHGDTGGATWLRQSMLPFASSNTLTRLDLDIVYLGDEFKLDHFFSLQHVCLFLPDDLLVVPTYPKCLKDCPSRLRSFEIEVSAKCMTTADARATHREYWESLFSYPCLRGLREIRVALICDRTVDGKELYVFNCMEIFEVMSQKIVFLEKVYLWGGLDFRRVGYFGGLQNLKSLCWDVLDGCLLGLEGSRESPGRKMRTLLGQFSNRPRVSIRKVGGDFRSRKRLHGSLFPGHP
jgi:hypothetical protein